MTRVVVLRATAAEPLGEHVLGLRDLGYDVHVLAAGPAATEPHEVDGVTVQTAPVRPWLAPGSHIARSPRWTRPLGYRLMVKAKTREAAARSRLDQARFLHDVAVARSGGTRPPATARARLLVARVQRRWVAERAEHTREAYRLRRARQRVPDKIGRRWWRLTARDHAWARLDPAVLDAEVHLGPLLDAIDADVLHAEGAVMMSVAVRSASRRPRPLPVVWDRTTDRKPKKPWVAEARRLLVAEYRDRVAQTVKKPTREDLAAAYAAVGAAPAPSAHLEGTP